ncbi:hypothetical protein NB723_000538 [Xanthomonas sacchari]|nr:hypothetical protein [Xanthomonas sacchari]
MPVLSTTSAVSARARSSTSASRIRMPARAPTPVPTMIAVGVARPSAHGQAITNTATACTSASAKLPPSAQVAPRVSAAIASTAGTNTAAIRSTRRWIGAREPCAASTMRTICANRVSAPTPVARARSRPSWLTVAACRRLPGALATGMASPDSIASSTLEWPSSTSPSTGTRSPAATTNTSPTASSAASTSTMTPSRSTRAVVGARSSSARTAAVVRRLARASSRRPSSTRVMTLVLASKYTCWPCRPARVTTALYR